MLSESISHQQLRKNNNNLIRCPLLSGLFCAPMKLSFKDLVSDLSSQNTAWREFAQKAQDYYDHLQITGRRQKDLIACEQLDLIGNLIQPTVNSVLGHEEKRRVDWMVLPDDEPSRDIADALNQKLNEAMRLSNANHECSEAYKDQIIKGLGWVFIERNPDPFAESDYLLSKLHMSEVFWDMRSRNMDLSDCRWWSRRKFMDQDDAEKLFPKEKKLIKELVNGWEDASFTLGDEQAEVWHSYRHNEYTSAATANTIEHIYDGQSSRKRIAVYEVYYRESEDVEVVRYADGRKEKRDKKNLMQSLALSMKSAKVCHGVTTKMRRKWFIGPHEIADEPSPHPHNKYPAVPFWGYREDTSNTPYGIVRGMIDPQDAFNEVGFKMMHIIDHKRVIKEVDASPMKDSEIIHELNRKDGVINVDTGRLGSLVVEKDWSEFQALRGERDVYQQQIRDFSGVYSSYSGTQGQERSGVAIASMAELGATTLGEIDANYEFGRKLLGELKLAFIVDDIGENQVNVDVKDGKKVKKKVCINGEPNEPELNNNLAMARKQVALAPVSSAPGMMAQEHQRYSEMYSVSAGDPILQRLLMKMVLKSSNTPSAAEVIEEWEELTGQNVDPQQQAMQQQQEMQVQQQAMQLETAKIQSEIAKNQATAEANQATATWRAAESAKTVVETEKLMDEKDEMAELIARKRAAMQAFGATA